MNRFTLQQRWDLLEKFISKIKENWSVIARKCHTKFGSIDQPTVPGIRKFIAKVRETGCIVDASRRKCACTGQTSENIE